MGMGGAWGEEGDHIEKWSNCQTLGPQESGAKEHDSWFMGYLTEGRRSNSRMKILLMSLPMAMHQLVLSKSCTKNIPTISFEWNFSDMFLWALKARKKLWLEKSNDKSEILCKVIKSTRGEALHGFLLRCKSSSKKKYRRQFPSVNASASLWVYAHFFPQPHSSHEMRFLSTCRLIPLLTAGRPFNWYTPPQHGWGSTLMKLHLGAPVLVDYMLGVMISSVASASASGCFNLPTGCLLMLTVPSQFQTAQQVCIHSVDSGAIWYIRTNIGV